MVIVDVHTSKTGLRLTCVVTCVVVQFVWRACGCAVKVAVVAAELQIDCLVIENEIGEVAGRVVLRIRLTKRALAPRIFAFRLLFRIFDFRNYHNRDRRASETGHHSHEN